MDHSALFNEEQSPVAPPSFAQVARANAIKVAIGASVILTAFAVVAVAINNWSGLLWMVALGGHFWGAVAVGGVALISLAWTYLMLVEAPQESGRVRMALIGLLVILNVVFILASLAIQTTFAHFSDLSTYQQAAVVLMAAPYVLAFIAMLISDQNQKPADIA